MTGWRGAVKCLIAGWLGLLATVGSGSPQDVFAELVPPDLVLAHAAELGLSAEQRQAVQRILADLHPRQPPLLRQMREERDALMALLATARPEEVDILARFDRLNAIETELKRLRLQMTTRTRKVLTAEQQAKALALQRKRVSEGGASGGTGTLQSKLRRVREGLEQWKREGRDVARLRALWERFREAEDRGFYRQARQALDEAIALLDAPPARE
jgi:Spy/CpxP family protein refolding chaperone